MKNDNKFKGKMKVALILVVVVLIASSVLYFFRNSTSQEKKLKNKIEVIGKDFYENMYYDHIVVNKSDEEVVEFFSKFIEIGIKIDLDNLSRFDESKYPNLFKEFTNKKTKESCNVQNTKAIIYPSEPFTKTDYTIESELDCGF